MRGDWLWWPGSGPDHWYWVKDQWWSKECCCSIDWKDSAQLLLSNDIEPKLFEYKTLSNECEHGTIGCNASTKDSKYQVGTVFCWTVRFCKIPVDDEIFSFDILWSWAEMPDYHDESGADADVEWNVTIVSHLVHHHWSQSVSIKYLKSSSQIMATISPTLTPHSWHPGTHQTNRIETVCIRSESCYQGRCKK